MSLRATWNGWLWIGVLLIFRTVGRLPYTWRNGVKPFRVFKISGPIVVVIAASAWVSHFESRHAL